MAYISFIRFKNPSKIDCQIDCLNGIIFTYCDILFFLPIKITDNGVFTVILAKSKPLQNRFFRTGTGRRFNYSNLEGVILTECYFNGGN